MKIREEFISRLEALPLGEDCILVVHGERDFELEKTMDELAVGLEQVDPENHIKMVLIIPNEKCQVIMSRMEEAVKEAMALLDSESLGEVLTYGHDLWFQKNLRAVPMGQLVLELESSP